MRGGRLDRRRRTPLRGTGGAGLRQARACGPRPEACRCACGRERLCPSAPSRAAAPVAGACAHALHVRGCAWVRSHLCACRCVPLHQTPRVAPVSLHVRRRMRRTGDRDPALRRHAHVERAPAQPLHKELDAPLLCPARQRLPARLGVGVLAVGVIARRRPSAVCCGSRGVGPRAEESPDGHTCLRGRATRRACPMTRRSSTRPRLPHAGQCATWNSIPGGRASPAHAA
jgi:hypothetical protein